MNANLQSLIRLALTAAGTGYAVKAGVSADCAPDVVGVAADMIIGGIAVSGSYLWSVVNNGKKAQNQTPGFEGN